MTHYYEKNIVDIKNEYTSHLTEILVPLLYEGITAVYVRAKEHCDKYDELIQLNSNIQNPGIVKIFQLCLKDIPSLSANAIASEVQRIKEHSHCSEWFDDLVKAVIKSYIVLLTYNASGKRCRLVRERYHERININEFIHKCYIECAHTFHNNPELIVRELEFRKTQKELAYKYIKKSIIEAIHKMLPIKSILEEYLGNDYIVDSDNISQSRTQQYVNSSRSKVPKIFEDDTMQNGFSVVKDETNGIFVNNENDDSLSDDNIQKNTTPLEIAKELEEVIKKEEIQIKNSSDKKKTPEDKIETPKPDGVIIQNIMPDGTFIKQSSQIHQPLKQQNSMKTIPETQLGGDMVDDMLMDKYFDNTLDGTML